MNNKHKIILSVLNSTQAITAVELFEKLEPDEQGLLGSKENMSKILFDLRDPRRSKFWVKNGESVYENGRAILTWMITDAGKKALAIEDTPNQLDELIAEEFKEEIMDDEFVLNPDNNFELAMIEIVSAIRNFNAAPEQLVIERKAQKLDTLNRLSGILSSDFGAVLADIAKDIEQLEEA